MLQPILVSFLCLAHYTFTTVALWRPAGTSLNSSSHGFCNDFYGVKTFLRMPFTHFSPSADALSPPVGITLNGSYYGVHNKHFGVDAFLGIPFAQSPVGDLRLRVPLSLDTTWSGLRNATEHGYACIGYGEDTEMVTDNFVHEDCLTLDIVRPSGLHSYSPLPVLVWIYGGGFSSGASRDQRYNMTFIVEQSVKIRKPIMAVSINYRLAGYGFLYSEDIVRAGVANLGLRDQRIALHWVQENIRGFGGDPSKVTIWGESAGALSVGLHLRAFNGRNDKLFRGAWANSGPLIGLGIFGTTQELVKKVYNNLTVGLGCDQSSDQLACLRRAPAEKFQKAVRESMELGASPDRLPYMPLVDGDIIARAGISQVNDGAFVKVPYVIGDNTDEGTAFAAFGLNSDEDIMTFLHTYGFSEQDTIEILRKYPLGSWNLILSDLPPWNSTIGAQFSRLSTILGDIYFLAPRRISTDAWIKHTDVPVYLYRFDVTPNGVPKVWSSTHFMELGWFFRNLNGTGYSNRAVPFLGPNPFENLPQTARDLADDICARLISFVESGSPNQFSDNTVFWPPFTNYGRERILFSRNYTTSQEKEDVRSEQLDSLSKNFLEGSSPPWNQIHMQ